MSWNRAEDISRREISLRANHNRQVHRFNFHESQFILKCSVSETPGKFSTADAVRNDVIALFTLIFCKWKHFFMSMSISFEKWTKQIYEHRFDSISLICSFLRMTQCLCMNSVGTLVWCIKYERKKEVDENKMVNEFNDQLPAAELNYFQDAESMIIVCSLFVS